MSAVINWESALEQVGGDEEFLNEVLGDLLTESDTAETDLKNAIETKNFDSVMKAAHRIKGSASYLCCEQLRETSFQLQNMGHEGLTLTDANAQGELFNQIIIVYQTFQENLAALRAEISKRLNDCK